MQAINQQSRRERLAAYRRNPFSLFLAALVTLSAVITLAVLVSLIIYILGDSEFKAIPVCMELQYRKCFHDARDYQYPEHYGNDAAVLGACRYLRSDLSGGICKARQ